MSLRVINPYNQEVVCELPYDDDRGLEIKIHRALHALKHWRQCPLRERKYQIRQGLSRFRERGESIARDITLQMGKPLSQSQREVQTFFDRAEYMITIAEEALSPDILPPKTNFHRRIEHEPLGLILNLAAWNYPLLIPVNIIVPALLAGNVVLLKHSAKTPLCGLHFEDAFGQLDIPHLVSNLILSHAQTLAMINDNRIDHVAFTGSVEGGHQVYAAAARRFIDVGLELGGKDPAYVAEDATLDFSAENVVDGACYNAGQSCCAVERVYVHQRLYEPFLTQAKAVLDHYRLGDPLLNTTTMGPLVNAAALETVQRQVDDALQRGARLLFGGKRWEGHDGYFFLPTLLADVPQEALVMQEESFGPLVPIQRVSNDDEALSKMNASPYGLTASVWTQDRKRAERFARDLRVGTVFQNRCDYLDPALPWTGMGNSGKGSTLSHYGFYHLTRRKSIHFRSLI